MTAMIMTELLRLRMSVWWHNGTYPLVQQGVPGLLAHIVKGEVRRIFFIGSKFLSDPN